MRPDVGQEQPPPEPDRIIHLGDVRRRPTSRRRAPDRHYLAALTVVTLVAWVAWLAVVVSLPPARLLSYLAFFAPLWLALATSGAILAYTVEWRRGGWPGLIPCGRRGALGASVIVLNLACKAASHWSPGLLAISVVAAVVTDIALARRAA
jgi:hypothetical protein